MAVLLFRLRNVPDDEADAVRELLNARHIEIYETSAGAWGIGTPAIWLVDDEDTAWARDLIAEYEDKRSATERGKYKALREAGEHRRFVDICREHPLRVVLYIAFSLFLLYVTIRPFFVLGD